MPNIWLKITSVKLTSYFQNFDIIGSFLDVKKKKKNSKFRINI